MISVRARFRLSWFLLPLGSLASSALGQEQDTPAEPRGLVSRSAGALEGLTLFPPLRSTTTYLVDLDGEMVHSWPSEHTPGNSAYLLEDGSLLRCARVENDLFEGGGQGGKLQRIAWDGTVQWDFDLSNDRLMHHHDVEPLPNGNVLVIAWEAKTQAEAVAAGRDPGQVGDKGFWPDCVLEIEPILPDGGKVVWEWHAFDHLVQDFDPEQANYGDVTAHPERVDVNADHRDRPPLSAAEREEMEELERQMAALGYTGDDEDAEPGDGPRERLAGDWLHTNGIDYDPEHDLILLSVRSLSEVWILDHSTTTAEAAGSSGGRFGHGGDLLTRWGNPRTYGRGDDSDRRLFVQHDATFVAPPAGDTGALHILVFNNGRGRPGGDASSVDEIALPFDPERGFVFAAEGPRPPADLAWTFQPENQGELFSSFISGSQRLTNGNTLVCFGVPGRLVEVTRDGDVVWDYLNPYGDVPREGRPKDRGGPGGRGRPGGAGPQDRDGPPDRAGPPDRDGGQDQTGAPDRAGGRDRPQDGARRGGGGGGPGPKALFRGTRLASDHRGLRFGALKAEIRGKFPDVRQLSVFELAARDTPPLLLDVREPREFEVSHLPGARRARTKAEALALLGDVPRDTAIVLYCSVGYRSSGLAEELASEGYSNVANLEGSIFEWANAGRPLMSSSGAAHEVHPYDEDWGKLLQPELRSEL